MMANTSKEKSWRSIHSDYLHFAVLSFRACCEEPSPPAQDICLDRHAVETIRYAYDCLEAVVEFIRHMGLLKQLPVEIQENWFSRYLERNWEQLNLSDRIGILAYAWSSQRFWQTEKQLQLFEDLKKVREGLTQPIPFGAEIEQEIIARRELNARRIRSQSQLAGGSRPARSERQFLGSRKAVADFKQNPVLLGKADAEQALEILLCHLVRFEEIYFGECTRWFSFYEREKQALVSPKDLLKTLNRRFKAIWEIA
jgi:hypothetical protein